MRRFALLFALTVLVIVAGTAQQWNRVWKLTTPPYLTLENILDMGMVKAGFDTDKDGWGEIICTWTDADTNAIMMYEADGNNSYRLVWSWVYPIEINSFAGIAVGDLNDNGVVEIVTTLPSVVGTDPNPLRVWVFEWNGVVGQNAYGFFNSATKTYDPSGGWNYEAPDNYDLRPYSLTIEDIDKDGKNELITGFRLRARARNVKSSFLRWTGILAVSSPGTSNGSILRPSGITTASRRETWTTTGTEKSTCLSGTTSR